MTVIRNRSSKNEEREKKKKKLMTENLKEKIKGDVVNDEYQVEGSYNEPLGLKSTKFNFLFLVISYLITFWIGYQFLVLSNDRPSEWDQLSEEFNKLIRDPSTDLYQFNDTLLEGISSNFSPELAYSHLLRLGTEIHSYNTLAIAKVENYLVSYLKVIQALHDETRGRGSMVIDFDRRTSLVSEEKLEKLSKLNRTTPVYFEVTNLLVRVKGTDTNNSSALLLSAHYDSQGSSHGASDDGISVAILLEVLRHQIHYPPKQDMIFNFNNGEEKGLMGSKGFLNHPWHSDVTSFINLEASGVGGKPLIFQATSKALLDIFSHAPYPHASVIGNDVFKLKVLNSRTDFEVYHRAGIPGIDMALYSNRAFYHTRQDDVNHIYYTSLKNFGDTILTVVDGMNHLPSKHLPEGSVFFDILGVFMTVVTFETMQILVSVTIVIQVFFITLLFRRLRLVEPIRTSLTRKLLLAIRSVNSIVFSIVLFVSLSWVVTKLWMIGSGVHIHSFSLWIYLSYAPLVLFSFLVSLSSWQRYERLTPITLKYVIHLGMNLFCLFLQVGNLMLLDRGIGSFYIILMLTYSQLMVTLVELVSPRSTLLGQSKWKIQLILSNLYTSTIQGVFISFLLCLSQGIPTGSSKPHSYYLCSGLSFISLLSYLPLLSSMLIKVYRSLNWYLLLSWVLSYSLILYRFPLSSTSPLVFHFDQHLCITPTLGCHDINPDPLHPLLPSFNTSFSRIIGPAYLPEALQSFPEPITYSSYSDKFHQAHYVGPDPTFPIPLNDLISTRVISSTPHPSGYEVQLQLSGYSSHLCAIRFHSPLTGNVTVTTSTSTPSVPLPSPHAYLMRRNVTTPFQLHLTTSHPTTTLRFSTWCGYDDADLFIPAFLQASHQLPSWSLLSTVMPALLAVHADFEIDLSSPNLI